MRRLTTLFTLLLAFAACEKSNPVSEDFYSGPFTATIASADSSTLFRWTEGDVIILSNCKENLEFKDGVLVPSENAELITVTTGMMSQDGLTVKFESSVPASSGYALLTAGDFSGISGFGVDGTVEFKSLDAGTVLNCVASATTSDGNFQVSCVNKYFSISVYDKRALFLDVSVGYSDFSLKIDSFPVTYYFPIPLDEDLSDGIYANLYDKNCEKYFTEHYTGISLKANQVCDLGFLMDFKGVDSGIIKDMLADNDSIEDSFNLEGEVLKRYLDEVQYDNDYSWTKIKDYVPRSNEPASVRPAYVSVKGLSGAKKIYLVSDDYEILARDVSSSDKQAIYNLIPGRTYKYGVVSVDETTGEESLLKKGCFATEGRVRVIKTTIIHNVRDVGGWEGLDGKHIRYGILIRGAEIRDRNGKLDRYENADYESLVCQTGIDFDLDFRTDEGSGYYYKSPFGLEFKRIPLSDYDSIVLKKDRHYAFVKSIRQFIKNAKEGKCTYVHCQGGADRTGTFVFYIEGLLGVSDSDLCKDYELTSFYYHKERNDPERYLSMIQALRKLYGNDCTIGEAIIRSAHDMGITDREIQTLRDLMLE